MSLLAPLYFFGAFAIGLPILFHLIRRRPKGEVEFSSLMFLRPTPPRLTRRSRLDNWPLLLLRALALMLLAAAFARPFLRSVALSDAELPGRRIVLLVDTSASMQRAGLWQQALDKSRDVLSDLARSDELAIVTFDDKPTTLLSFEQTNRMTTEQLASTAENLLRETAPSWRHTDMGRAISFAADLATTYEPDPTNDSDADDEIASAATRANAPAQLILVSDMQSGSQIESLQVYAWPDQLRLDVKSVLPQQRTNASATILASGPESVEDTERVRVRVTNSADATLSRFRIAWAGSPVSGSAAESDEDETAEQDASASRDRSTATELPVQVPPGESRVVRMPTPAPGITSLVLRDDAHTFDNTRFVVSPQPESLTLLHVGKVSQEPRDSLLYYLKRVPLDNDRRSVSIESIDGDSMKGDLDPKKVPLVILSDAVTAEVASWIRQYVRGGGRVLAVLSEQAKADGVISSVNTIAEVTLAVEEATVEDYAMFSRIDFANPVFESMADPQFNDFSKIRIWSHRTIMNLDQSWRIAASFDDGDPALIERAVGDGNLLVLAAGWQPKASQLALSTKFIPLVFRLFDSSPSEGGSQGYAIGESIAFEPSDTATITGPTGSAFQYSSAADLDQIDQPGIYEFRDRESSHRFAVNLGKAESQTEPLGEDAFERFDVIIGKNVTAAQAAENQRQLRDRELESQQRLWQWLLVIALGVLGLETFLGARWSRRREEVAGESLAGAE